MAATELAVLWEFVREVAGEDYRGHPPRSVAKAQTLMASRCSCWCHQLPAEGCTTRCCDYPNVMAWLFQSSEPLRSPLDRIGDAGAHDSDG